MLFNSVCNNVDASTYPRHQIQPYIQCTVEYIAVLCIEEYILLLLPGN